MIVLAVDVGIQVCGFCVADVKNLAIKLIKEGEIRPDAKNTLPQKLNYIFNELKKESKHHRPGALIAETLYSHHRHPTTLGVLAQVRGVVALLTQQEEIEFFEYSPTRARKSFLGRGNADSEQVKKMAQNIVGREFKSIHTADAFSLIIAFSHTQKLKRLIRETLPGRDKPVPYI